MNFFGLFQIQPSWIVILQMVIRFLLAGIIGFAAVKLVIAAFEWIYWDENAVKAYEAKEQVGIWIIVVTIVFVLMGLFRLWVPAYDHLAV